MEPGDDDERANAYQRYIFNEFADIVHHYDNTADNVDHDQLDDDDFHNLDYLDGAEYDINGDPIINYGLEFVAAVDEFGSWDDIPDDYEFNDDAVAGFLNLAAALHEASEQYDDARPDNIYRYPLYDPDRGPCKRRRGVYYQHPDSDSPPV